MSMGKSHFFPGGKSKLRNRGNKLPNSAIG